MAKDFDVRHELFEWAQSLALAMIVFGLVFAFVCRPIGVEGDSMLQNLETGDKLLITNIFYTPSRGDVVMFTKRDLELPGHGKGNALVKRVIGVPGDVIDITFNSDAACYQLVLNGKTIDEEYINGPMTDVAPVNAKDQTVFPYTVKENEYFCMGDNRNRSIDSRTAAVGPVDKNEILGHVLFRILPFNKMGQVHEPIDSTYAK